MTRQTLLPPNHTPFEEAFDLTGARIDELPVDVPKLVRPWEIPPSHLPWLAWGLSVDLWEPDWSEEKHRTLTARALPMHARKGTQASIAEHIRIMGADPRRFIVPPAKTFLMETLTEEEREAFLARFPQLRIYPFVARGTYRFAHFTSAAFGRAKAFLDACCIKDVGAWSRFIRTARLWDRGAESPLTLRAVTPEGVGRFHAAAFDEVVLGARSTRALHLDAPPKAKAFLVDDFGVAQRLIRIPRAASYDYRLGRETYTTTYPDAVLVDVRPQNVAERHEGQPNALYATRRQFISGKHLPQSIAWQHIYERWHLHDPDRVPDVRVRSTHLGYARLGMPPFHAEIRTRISGTQAPRTAGLFVTGHLMTGDRRPISQVRAAVRVSKALRDRILLDTRTYRLPRVGDRPKAGTVTLGRFIAA
ncbi:phage tail protein I [Aestuariivirga sp.]|uniref:phage tail protein I n=1 Tax=Aestuariivirga sp. TaxID=2650926 RepID=UPI003919036D